MKKIAVISLFFIWLTGFLTSCSDDSPESKGGRERSPIELTSESRAVAENLKDFYTVFTGDVAHYMDSESSQKENGNFICSPLGVAMILGMTANGVEETSQESFRKYLGVDDISSLNDFAYILIQNLPNVDDLSKCKIANSLWINKSSDLKLNGSFSDRIKGSYFSDIFYSDFSSDSGISSMCKWCSQFIGDDSIFPYENINPDCIALFLNALYLKAPWRDIEFDPAKTSESIFHGVSGETMIDMMQSNSTATYISDSEDFTLCKLPLGNGTFSFDVLIPNENLSITEASKKLSSGLLEELRSNLKRESTVYRLPKFCMKNMLSISEVFGKADKETPLGAFKFSMFEGLANSYSPNYYQNIAFSIDETGAEIQSVSVSELMSTSPAPTYREITIDRPFFFFINEYSTGACLLSGRVTDL